MTNEYEVGYGKPPKKHQFKPGYSGNKKGRPKGSPNINTMVNEISCERISIYQNGKKKKSPSAKLYLENWNWRQFPVSQKHGTNILICV